jgi:hypothetical protein
MKRKIIGIAAITAILFSSTAVMAQESKTKQKTTFGVRAGVNFQNINGKDNDGDKLNNMLIPGINLGANVEIPVAKDFYVQPGLLFTTKGGKAEYKNNEYSYTQTTHLAYLEIPMNGLYKPQLGTGHLLAGFGPYIEIGLGGKVKYSGTGAPSDKDIIFKNTVTAAEASNGAYSRRVGAGANFLFGYEFANKFSAQLNAQLGLTNLHPKYDDVPSPKASAKNTGFGVSVGYRF